MAQTKNLCAQVPINLHQKISEARELAESEANANAQASPNTAPVSPSEAPEEPDEGEGQAEDKGQR